jgi:endonuclease/exonuclease/phosphatase (EEP) superfamily protein YafD
MRRKARSAGSVAAARILDVGTDLAVGGLVALVGLRALPRDVHRLQIALEGGREAAMSFAPVLAALAIVRRRPVTALVGAALSVQSRSTRQAHRVETPEPPRPVAPTLRVVTANLLSGNRRIADLGRQLMLDAADVVVVQELTPEHLDGLRAAGLLDVMPHQVLDPQPGYHGSGLLARWPIDEAAVLDVHGMGMAAATVHGPAGPVHVVAVHVVNPARTGMIPVWQDQLNWLAGYARRAVRPVVLAGDYNATTAHRGIRVLAAAGMVDAHDAAGRGLGLTWPQRSYAGGGRWPAWPVMRLDHVFVTAASAVRSVRTAVSAGSDHRRIIADLVVQQR